MECEVNEQEVSCIVCNNFKVPIKTIEIVKKIAEIVGASKIERIEDGRYLLYNNQEDEIEVTCEREFFDNWSDYCIRCYVN